MASGGKRVGAGRKKRAEKYEGQINRAEKKIADKLPQIVDNLLHLANGGYERVEEKFERVCKVNSNGYPVLDEDGAKQYDFVLVERKVSIADKDRAANIALLDRIMGKPTEYQEVEQKVSGEVEITDKARKEADAKLSEWQKEMQEKLLQVMSSSPPGEPPSLPPA